MASKITAAILVVASSVVVSWLWTAGATLIQNAQHF